MFERKPRLSYFLLGLFTGALVGGITVYHNAVITNENKISVNLIPKIVSQVVNALKIKNKEKPNTDDGFTPDLTNAEEDKEQKNSILANDNQSLNEYVQDTLKNQTNDSNARSEINVEENNLVIKKDKLIASKEVSVLPLDFDQELLNHSTKADSLLSVVSDTRLDHNSNVQKVVVEFWESPINYKGYMDAGNKLILYGLDEQASFKLATYKNTLFIKYHNEVYELNSNHSYNNFSPCHKHFIIEAMNKL